MARYLGPKCKLSRREGTDLLLKSGVGAHGAHAAPTRQHAEFGCSPLSCAFAPAADAKLSWQCLPALTMLWHVLAPGFLAHLQHLSMPTT